jgi:hypothetical protein
LVDLKPKHYTHLDSPGAIFEASIPVDESVDIDLLFLPQETTAVVPVETQQMEEPFQVVVVEVVET